MRKLRIKKSILSVFMLSVLVVSVLGYLPKENVLAAQIYTMHVDTIDEYGSDDTPERPRVSSYRDYRFTAGDSAKMYLLYSSWDRTDVLGTPYKNTICYWIFVTTDSNDTAVLSSMTSSNGNTVNESLSGLGSFSVNGTTYYTSYNSWSGGWQEYTSNADATVLVDYDAIQNKYGLSYSNDVMKQALISYLGGEDDDIVKEADSNNTAGGYSLDVGALKNVSYNLLYPNGATNVDSCYRRFRYASKTTTGVSLKDSGTKVRVYESMTYYKRSDNTVYSEGNKVLVGVYDATNLQFDIDVNEAFNKCADGTESKYIQSSWSIVSKQIERDDRIYLQVVSSSGNYGPYLCIDGASDSVDYQRPQSVVDDDGNQISDEDGGYTKDDTEVHIGSSDDDDLDSADADASSKPSRTESYDSSIEDATNTLQGLLGMVGNIPKIISQLFSFLPEWCLNLLGLAFAAAVILLIYKLVRG